MKFQKTQQKQPAEYLEKMDADGLLTVDQWTSGSGRFTKPKTLPPFVSCEVRGKSTCKAANAFFAANPKRQKVLALDKEKMSAFLFEAAYGKEIPL